MSREVIVAKLKEFVYHEIDMVKRYNYDAHGAVTRCYGAMMFVINLGDFDDELSAWWDSEMLPVFYELERGK